MEMVNGVDPDETDHLGMVSDQGLLYFPWLVWPNICLGLGWLHSTVKNSFSLLIMTSISRNVL